MCLKKEIIWLKANHIMLIIRLLFDRDHVSKKFQKFDLLLLFVLACRLEISDFD